MSPEPFADFRGRLTAANLGVPIEWPNEPFQQPNIGVWAAIDTTADVDAPIEIGGAGWQEQGRAWVHLYAPAFSGSDVIRALAKSVANVFRGIGPNDTVYLGAAIGAGQVEEPAGVWWRLTVAITYRYQDSTSA